MLSIVDSHVHFWEPGRLRYAWLDEFPQLNRPCLPDHVPARGDSWAVQALIFVQADCAPEQNLLEVDWVADLAASDPRLRAIVAFAPLEAGAGVRPVLEALTRRPLVKGIRRLLQSEPAGFSLQPDFVTGVRLLAEHDLRCDMCVRHAQLPEVTQLVDQCPAVSFVLDHIGKPDIKHGRLDPWRKDLAALAARPNVMCKLSGLVTEADWQGWQAADLRPYVDHTLEAFGAERVMFGSDAPVVTLAATYAQWLETVLQATRSLSEAERGKLFCHNASRFYGVASP